MLTKLDFRASGKSVPPRNVHTFAQLSQTDSKCHIFCGEIWKSCDETESEKHDQGIRDSITRIIKKREEEKIGEERNCGSDFLGKLLEAYQDNRISIDDIIDECKNFYFAGQETMSSLLGWTIFLPATNKEWQEKARKEVVESFGHKVSNADGLSRLKTMNMILDESLRLYPPVPFIKRKVDNKVELGKLTLPPKMESNIATNNNPVANYKFSYA
ncbi:hypothetical protein KY289_034363 [Solanum tuberosum]|nr:hypothetical protein KY289_034363 [Solanum tuberosum]KAH0646177.1 hypothetical protein KY284_034061 [Solanum tuberosum]